MRVCRKFICNHKINGKNDLHALLGSLFKKLPRKINLVLFDERVADGIALRCIKCVRHATANDDGIHLVNHILNDADFIRDLGPAEDGDKRALRCFERLADVVDFHFHEKTRHSFKICRDADIRSVGTVRYTEGVIHRHIGKRSKLLCKCGVILLLLLMVA